MSEPPKARVLFIGMGTSGVAYHRCMLPAKAGGWDWVGVIGDPPDWQVRTGDVGGRTVAPDPFAYDVVIVQQAKGPAWHKLIVALKKAGVRVLYEVDDYLHGIAKRPDHDFSRYYGHRELQALELCMRASDGLIVSTDYLARRYRRFARGPVFVCRNGVDCSRYALTIPDREGTVNIGWAGATGHRDAVGPWLQQVANVMGRHAHVNFVSIGMPMADNLLGHFGAERALSIPWVLVEQLPAAMTNFDIVLAPGHSSAFFRGKSDLRWLEAAALGLPAVADPVIYPGIEDGITGFHAKDARHAGAVLDMLVQQPSFRLQVGGVARDVVRSSRDISQAVVDWRAAVHAIVDKG